MTAEGGRVSTAPAGMARSDARKRREAAQGAGPADAQMMARQLDRARREEAAVSATCEHCYHARPTGAYRCCWCGGETTGLPGTPPPHSTVRQRGWLSGPPLHGPCRPDAPGESGHGAPA